MLTLDTTRDMVNKAISNLVLKTQPVELYDPIRYTLSVGGKRLRPCMVIMACNLFNDRVDEAIHPALAIEIFHNFTLLHDDIMDDSSIRRNQPTVHKKWNRNIAILSGDVMAFLAYGQLVQTRTEIINDLIHIFTRTAEGICEGQQYDMNFESKRKVSESEYLKMIELKTAVLMGASLKIGAVIGGASTADAESMYAFGKNLGMAFQLQDDLLDVYGDPKIFGKTIGGDIVGNKKTYLLVKMVEMADENLQEKIINLLDERHLEREEKIRSIKSMYDKYGIKQRTNEMVNSYFRKAKNNLEKVHVQETRKKELRKLALSLLDREK
jgi:geranylgeranyl diphosphate synthase type II